ncbi:MAG: hypothetical protein ACFWT2_03110 [Thermoanaerobacterium thermosaccharolyticum]
MFQFLIGRLKTFHFLLQSHSLFAKNQVNVKLSSLIMTQTLLSPNKSLKDKYLKCRRCPALFALSNVDDKLLLNTTTLYKYILHNSSNSSLYNFTFLIYVVFFIFVHELAINCSQLVYNL